MLQYWQSFGAKFFYSGAESLYILVVCTIATIIKSLRLIKTIFRLHRKLFMLRRPNAYTLTLARGKKAPTLSLQIAQNRSPFLGALLTVLAFALTAWLAAKD